MVKRLDSRLAVFAALVVTSLVALAPIWETSNLPLKDYPNHLARMYILAQDGNGEALNHFYRVDWRLLPNLAMDVTVPFLARVIGVEAAGKVFLSLTLVVILTGVVALHYSIHRRYSAWPFLAAILLYNRSFLWGFVNYVFGIGVAFLLAAGWIRLRTQRIAWVAFPVAAIILFFLHAVSFGVYLIIIAGYEIGLLLDEQTKWRQLWPRGAKIAIQALPALIILFIASPTGKGSQYTGPFFSDLREKVISLPLFIAHHESFFSFMLLFLLLAAGFLVGLAAGVVKLNRLTVVPLTLMIITYFALPEVLMSSWYAWGRFMLPIFMFAIASTDWCIQRLWVKVALGCVVGAVFLGRLGVLWSTWQQMSDESESIRHVMREIPQGVTLYPLSACLPRNMAIRVHLPTMAIVDRQAFVPTLFAIPTQQPVRFTSDAMALMGGRRETAPLCYKGSGQDWAPALRYDYVLMMDVLPAPESLPAELVLVTTSKYASLYRVVR